MDGARHRLIQLLWEADDHHRLGVYYPVTEGGAPIYVHSKVLVVDDRLLRIGSSNLNNRSMGFDSECDRRHRGGPEQHGTAMMSAARSFPCETNWYQNTWVCPSASSKSAMLDCPSVLAGRRGTPRTGQDVTAIHRTDSGRRGEPAGGERPDGSRPCPPVTDPKRATVHRRIWAVTERAGHCATVRGNCDSNATLSRHGLVFGHFISMRARRR